LENKRYVLSEHVVTYHSFVIASISFAFFGVVSHRGYSVRTQAAD